MDEIEGGILSAIPPAALALNLTRAAIRMEHSQTWRIDKSNPVDDLIICLEGRGHYLIDGEPHVMEPGDAMLIGAGQRFVGWNEGRETYVGVAQHFTLDIYGRHNLIAQMNMRPKLQLSRWSLLEPIARHYRQSAPPSSVSLGQHHLFMVLLIAFIEDAFLGWRDHATYQPEGADAIDLAVMKAATMISAHPLDPEIAAKAVDASPYNADYFLREFQKRVGRTPRKYQELKRMERAMHFLEGGLSVAAAAAEVGYSDPYYFSRMFKRTLGLSPRGHMNRVHQSRHGDLLQLDEPEQEIRLARAGAMEKRRA
ncbi:AraC family transcriptional regulator [Sinorhizobium sp. A49]|jgi:AraC-like DNA-binding protein|uniref:helix-turn-helix transcriptional regulator n=1 Tax=Sinorhizobium sp. A49 TaxID=1945861 RepID=UPI0009867CAA|nr:AraC family transcriptional regulator [Sinorhizobium sp. A49]OOG69700.1 AraC family transcriptional regulator [Sinorhizobium sp. A49]